MERISLNRLRRAVAVVAGELPQVAAVYAYGSRIVGDGLPFSDPDVAIVLRHGGPRDDPLLAERVAARIGPRSHRSTPRRPGGRRARGGLHEV